MRKEQETNEKLRDSLTTLSTTMKMKKIKEFKNQQQEVSNIREE